MDTPVSILRTLSIRRLRIVARCAEVLTPLVLPTTCDVRCEVVTFRPLRMRITASAAPMMLNPEVELGVDQNHLQGWSMFGVSSWRHRYGRRCAWAREEDGESLHGLWTMHA